MQLDSAPRFDGVPKKETTNPKKPEKLLIARKSRLCQLPQTSTLTWKLATTLVDRLWETDIHFNGPVHWCQVNLYFPNITGANKYQFLMVTEHMQSNRIEETEETYRIELNWDHLVNFILCYDTCLDQLLQFLPWNIPILLPLAMSRKHQAGLPISISMDINPYPYRYKDDNDSMQQMMAADNTKFLAGSVWGRRNWIS